MDTLQIIILALVQGLTEFLPISSSAHLILAPILMGYEDQGLAFDVAVHLGSLLAVSAYFRNELAEMLRDFITSFGPNGVATNNSRLAWMIIVATLPIMVVGKLLYPYIQTDLRSTFVIAVTTLLFGFLLLWADRSGEKKRDEFSISWKDALFIGGLQAIALIPGTSRSGITITGALILGLNRQAASRFSFLLSIPTILMSGALVTMDLVEQPQIIDWYSLMLGAILSCVAAYLCIHYFLKLIERLSMLPFVLYRLVLGGILLGIIL